MFEWRTVLTNLTIFIVLISLIFGLERLTDEGLILRDAFYYSIPVLGVTAVIVGLTLHVRYQRSKIFGPLIEGQLKKMGYELISERPLEWGEVFSDVGIAPSIEIAGIPVLRGQRTHQNERILHVISADGDEFVLLVAITRTWESGTTIKIVKRKPIKHR